MGDKEELERLRSHMLRKDETERQAIFNALSEIKQDLAVGVASCARVEEEQKRTTKILFGDESDGTPGLIKRVDRVEGKVGLVWTSLGVAVTTAFYSAWNYLTGHKS